MDGVGRDPDGSRRKAATGTRETRAWLSGAAIGRQCPSVLNLQNQEILARKYRIRLRGIDTPESSMPYGKGAKEELFKLVQGKYVRVLVYGEDRYGRCVGDIYSNGKFVLVFFFIYNIHLRKDSVYGLRQTLRSHGNGGREQTARQMTQSVTEAAI
ncbi:hypothetical protein GQ457_05G031700 [Hibiscus cannabinus]